MCVIRKALYVFNNNNTCYKYHVMWLIARVHGECGHADRKHQQQNIIRYYTCNYDNYLFQVVAFDLDIVFNILIEISIA